VRLDAHVELPGAAALLPALARRAVKKGVDANLVTLKNVLEAGRPSSPSTPPSPSSAA
jgi:hypothetical protein